MEESVKEQSSVSGNEGKTKLQRYALRSAAKMKVEKVEPAKSSASRRARPPSAVSKSVGVLDLSSKDNPAKSPRRLSVPAKSNTSSSTRLASTITPILEARARRSANSQGKSETPLSDVSRSSSRRKFCALSSASYWLQQIKLSETAAKHSISLGFFKLALEAGCELQKLREELKRYAKRHGLLELKETLKELFNMYNIVEYAEKLQVSETCSHVPEEGTRSSDDGVGSSTSTTRARKIKPKSLNNDVAFSQLATEQTTEILKKNAVTKLRKPAISSSASSRNIPDVRAMKMQNKGQKPTKEGSETEKEKIKRQREELATQEGAALPVQDVIENKENLDAPPVGAV
ncbi:hypothetical protein SAY86_013030 [Trapa natans]|uniref:Uncharacterized protein n=1 Tax=Trapa natans TaxID=22666 RepID=A0AAN7MEN9_TRANT|nr:hypothetical protein SAY86_013030 [Trapa natans]